MRSFVLAVPAFAALALASAAGCSSSKAPASASAGDDGGAADSGTITTASFTMTETVPGGGEIFDCKYVQLADVDQWLIAGKHDYTPGSHHLLLYTTALTSIPAGGDQVQDCYEGAGGNSIMGNVTGVLYGGQTPTGSETYPQGVGLPTTANEVLVFQVHYLNDTANDLQTTVNVDLTFDTNPSDITSRAGIMFFYDPFIAVPAGATAKASMRCLIPSDVTLLYASSHYHSRGVGYDAYIDPAVDQLGTAPFYTSSSWSSPDNALLTMPIAAGSRLRFECDYDNSAGTVAYFSGQSAQTNEMCMFIGTYYPEMGEGSDFCVQGEDMFGTGTAACGATLSCMQACGGQLSLGGGAQSPPPDCNQTCIVDSCPTASAPYMDLDTCATSTCKTECADATSTDCATCLTTSCATQYATCQSHTCN
jgi:hypothetical protein